MTTIPQVSSPLELRRVARAGAGFTLVELLVVVAVLGIVAAIAIPNFQRAIRETRRKASYASMRQLEDAIEKHMADLDAPPDWSMDPGSLDQLVDSASLTPSQATGILARFEGDQLDFYWGSGAAWTWGGYDYVMLWRPKGEPDSWCATWPRDGWCWYPDGTWERIYE